MLLERPDAAGCRLIGLPAYTRHAVFTDLALEPHEIRRFDNGRVDCESLIEELELACAADGLCLRSFKGTGTSLQPNGLLFNLRTAFKNEVFEDGARTFGTLHHSLLVPGRPLRVTARRSRLLLGAPPGLVRRRRTPLLAWRDGLSPTVTQARGTLPSPWREHTSSPTERLRYCPALIR